MKSTRTALDITGEMKHFILYIAFGLLPILAFPQIGKDIRLSSGIGLYQQAQDRMEQGELHESLQLLQAATQSEEAQPKWSFELARLALYLEDSSTAAEAFQAYLLTEPTNSIAKQSLAWLVAGGPDSTDARVTAMPFNSPRSDFGGTPFGNSMVFASERNNSQFGVKYQSTISKTPLSNLYQVERRDSIQWKRNASPFMSELNSRLHEGTVWIHPDTTFMLFARSTRLGKGSATEGIWKSNFLNGRWQKPTPLSLNDANITVTHPWVDLNTGYLYFSSDHPQGLGGMDLYRVPYDALDWAQAENLGSNINGRGNEVYPTLTPAGILHFASTSHAGLGGLDLFSAQYLPTKAWKREHFGPPINSAQDDFAFYLNDTSHWGWFTSNRGQGNRNDNLYQVWLAPTPPPLFSDCESIKPFDYCYTFSDEITGESLPYGMRFKWDFGDGSTSNATVAPHCFAGPGTYHIKLQVTDSLTGEPIFNQASYQMEVEHPYSLFIEGPEEPVTGAFTSQARIQETLHLDVQDYYWDIGAGYTKGDQVAHLDMAAQDSILLGLGILATDPLGEQVAMCVERTFYAPGNAPITRLSPDTETTNPPLPDPRPTLPQRYEIQVGTSLQPISPGASLFTKIPDLKETFSDGVYRYWAPGDYTLEEALGALADFRKMGVNHPSVIREGAEERDFESHWLPADPSDSITLSGRIVDGSNTPVKGKLIWENLLTGEVVAETPVDANGNYRENLAQDLAYGYYVDLEGYYSVSHHLDLIDYQGDIVIEKDWNLTSIADMVRYQTPVRINNLFFDFDKFSIRSESYRELQRLTRFVQDNPGLKFHITGHADNIGSDDYNLVLSRKRAGQVARYLVLSGCDPSQISVVGAGESKPVANNNTDLGRQENRRVEFRITRLAPIETRSN